MRRASQSHKPHDGVESLSLVLLQSSSGWDGEYRSSTMPLYTHTHTLTHTHAHSLSLVLVVMIKSKELKTKISRTHSLILSLVLVGCCTSARLLLFAQTCSADTRIAAELEDFTISMKSTSGQLQHYTLTPDEYVMQREGTCKTGIAIMDLCLPGSFSHVLAHMLSH